MRLADDFLNTEQELALFYLWGHSYEFDTDNNWDLIEHFCEKTAHNPDVWYATNIEIYDYINSLNRLVIDVGTRTITNYSNIPLWIEIDREILKISPGRSIER